MKRNFRYLRGTGDYALILNLKSVELAGSAGAVWAGGADRASIAVDLMQLGGVIIYWKNIKHKCIAFSSTEADYVSL